MVQVYGLSETGQNYVAQASRIAAEVALPNAADVDTLARFPSESMKALADAGFYGLCVPKEFGGKGEDMRTFAGVVEELAGACGSTAMVYVMHVAAAQAIVTSSTLVDQDSILISLRRYFCSRCWAKVHSWTYWHSSSAMLLMSRRPS